MLFQLREEYFTPRSGIHRFSRSISEHSENAIKPSISAPSLGFSHRANREGRKEAERDNKHERLKPQQLETRLSHSEEN